MIFKISFFWKWLKLHRRDYAQIILIDYRAKRYLFFLHSNIRNILSPTLILIIDYLMMWWCILKTNKNISDVSVLMGCYIPLSYAASFFLLLYVIYQLLPHKDQQQQICFLKELFLFIFLPVISARFPEGGIVRIDWNVGIKILTSIYWTKTVIT